MLYGHRHTPVLIGRQQELHTLQTLLEQAERGQGGMVVVGGDTGIGKTRLCRELKAIAAQRNVRVVEGRCSRAEMNVPYGPFVDALRFRLSKGESDAAARVLEPVLAHVAPLFRGLTPDASLEVASATDAPFDRIYAVFSRLASLGTVLFIVEDIHWADATSIDLLEYMVRHIAKLPVLLVVTHRTDEVLEPGAADQLVTRLTLARSATRVQLEALSRAQVQEMLEAILGRVANDDLATTVFERTEGNPLFIEEYAGALSEQDRQHGLNAPTTLHEMVWDRIAPLDDDARDALNYASIIGRLFHFDVLAAALEWEEDRLLNALERLISYRLIVENQDAERESYSFRHIIVQEVLYGSFLGRRRRSMHRKVAAALESTDSGAPLPHSTLAHHYQCAGDLSSALRHTLLAGDEAARLCAWRDAAKSYHAAFALAERESAGAAMEAEVMERLAEVAWWQNQLDAHEHYLQNALRLRREMGETDAAASLMRKLARLTAHQRQDLVTAGVILRDALQLVSADGTERIYILNDLGRVLLKAGDWDAARSCFEESLLASSARGDCAEEALSLALLGVLAIHDGQLRAGTSRLELARALLSEHALSFERASEVYHAGIRAFEAARQHRFAREWVDAALAYAERHGAHADLAVYRAYKAAVQRRAGEWAPALQTAAEAVTTLQQARRAELREALRILADLSRARGDVAAALESYQRAVQLGEDDARIGIAVLQLGDEHWLEAAAQLEESLAKHIPADRLFAMRVLPFLAEAYLGAGRLDKAKTTVNTLRKLVRGTDYQAGHAACTQAAALLAGANGDAEAAVKQLRNAVAAWDTLSLPWESARARMLLAEQLLQTTKAGEAIAFAQEAARRFEELGAMRDVARAHSLLRRGGVRVARRRTAAARVPVQFAALTRRELEVFMELARGVTNREIARMLSLSPRTVDNHVSAILTKLGCATRTQAALLLQTSRSAD